MMRRTASEVVNELETRIAHLEKRAILDPFGQVSRDFFMVDEDEVSSPSSMGSITRKFCLVNQATYELFGLKSEMNMVLRLCSTTPGLQHIRRFNGSAGASANPVVAVTFNTRTEMEKLIKLFQTQYPRALTFFLIR